LQIVSRVTGTLRDGCRYVLNEAILQKKEEPLGLEHCNAQSQT